MKAVRGGDVSVLPVNSVGGRSRGLDQLSRIGELMSCRAGIVAARLREWLQFDSPFRPVAAFIALTLARLAHRLGRPHQAASIWCAVHRANYSDRVTRSIERTIARGSRRSTTSASDASLAPVYRDHVHSQHADNPQASGVLANPEGMLGALVIVLKAATSEEKGVVLMHYSFVFPIFAKLFKIEDIAQRYHIVLEPSWSGFCDLNILSYTQYRFPIFVEGFEPRDTQFIERIGSNLVSVPGSSNWWVDHRVFRPLPGVRKDVDVIMVAGWGAYKRHHRFFAALRTLRRRGVTPKVVLVGYPLGMSKSDILRQAACYGVEDQLECYEKLTQSEVNYQLNRAKVNIIWSRKEGVNRSVVEGMFAGVPCILRRGFNYGHHYPYVNAATGCYSSEEDLPDTLVRMIDTYDTYSSRDWVMANMSCQRAAQLLGAAMGDALHATGQSWSGDLAVKLNGLTRMHYWDASDESRFQPDYAFLRTMLRTPQRA
jgi:glycosyltransferase involved in cell wall biosynthesis